MLFWESKIIKVLKGKTALAGVHFVGQERTSSGKVYHIMIMDLLGDSLYEIHNKLNKRFDADTTLNVGIQVLTILMEIHQQGIIYRDLKPDNLLVGVHDPSKIFIVDFGLAKYYMEPKKPKETTATPLKEETKR